MARARLPLLPLLSLAAACGSAAAPSPIDAAADAPPDTGVITDAGSGDRPDTASEVASDARSGDSSDASDASDGASSGAACTLLSASCLGPFFEAATTCFAPAGGCTRSESAGTTTYCWQNGARYLVTTGGNVTWRAGSASCVHGARDTTMFSLILDSAPAAPLYFFAFDTGETACEGVPGRTTVDPSVASCPSFQALLTPDVSACTPGACN